jgi:hypothetical protein
VLGACAADTDGSASGADLEDQAVDDSDEKPAGDELAALTVRGMSVKFLRTSSDGVVILSGGKTFDSPMSDPALHGLSVVQIYEHLAGSAAPAALASLPAASEVLAVSGSSEPAPAHSSNKQTAEEFKAQFCVNRACSTDVWTDDIDWSGRAKVMDGAINLFNGDGVAVRIREDRPVKGWHTLLYWEVKVGEIWTWHATAGGAYARPMEANVEQRNNDISANGGFERSDRFHWMVRVLTGT